MSTKEKPVEEQSAEELVKTIAATAAEPPEVPAEEPPAEPPKETPAATPEAFSYTAGDGTVYRAGSSEELFKKVTDALNHSKTAIKDREHQIHDLRAKVPKEEPVKEEPVYDHKKYLELLETDGRAALDYADGFRPQIVAQRQERQETEKVNQVRDQVLRFYADVPDYTKIETPELNNLLKERIKEKGRSYTAEGLTATYYELKTEGKIPAPANGTPVKERKGMPASPGGSKTEVETEPDVDNMTTKELKAYMKKQGVPGAEYLQ